LPTQILLKNSKYLKLDFLSSFLFLFAGFSSFFKILWYAVRKRIYVVTFQTSSFSMQICRKGNVSTLDYSYMLYSIKKEPYVFIQHRLWVGIHIALHVYIINYWLKLKHIEMTEYLCTCEYIIHVNM
jgi:hypothetical protein